VTLNDVLSVPAGTPAGDYRLKVAMVDPQNASFRVQLGIDGRDAKGYYDLSRPISSGPSILTFSTAWLALPELPKRK
jgi:hypothetical protein